MTTETGLLAAIIAAPDEDTPRLAFADFLDENDRPAWAEFVRLQIELAKHVYLHGVDASKHARKLVAMGEPMYAPHAARYERLGDMQRREKELWPHLGVRLPAPGGRWLIPELAQFRRGFVESVTYTASDWLAVADLLHWHPTAAVECGHCVGRRPGDPDAHKMNHPCRVCWGKCEFPRPCPATAQPLAKVTLTTMPGVETIRRATTLYRGDNMSTILPRIWPGVEFVLPWAVDNHTPATPATPATV